MIFSSIPDHRVTGRCTYLLSDLLTIALLTYLCGGEDYVDMSEFANPNQMERAEDHCRNNIHSGLRKPHDCNEKVLHKRRGLSQSCVLQYVGTRTLDY